MRHYQCNCGNILFFDNSACTQCGTEVGYEVDSDQMVTLDGESAFQRCGNGIDYAVCNWVVPRGPAKLLCPSCLLNRTIPNLAAPGNLDAWHKIEVAKRRILYTLNRLGLAPTSKRQDEVNGLAFDFLRPTPGGPVLTGHEDGLITLNVDEAEDIEREKRKEQLGESYRTLIGHFRHEVAHYYWDRFFKDQPDTDPNLAAFREVFGDERADYNAALQKHYQDGPTALAPGEFITVYASVHPWEDWAETWAHYMHMIDGAETARSFGLRSEIIPIPFTPFPKDAITLPAQMNWPAKEKDDFLGLLRDWAKLSPAINEIVASLGHPAFYPFVFSETIIRKFFFVHHMIKYFGNDPALAAEPPMASQPEPVGVASA
jgi:hypothetical protein